MGYVIIDPHDNRHWHMRAICPGCGWHTHAPFGSVFHVHVDCCPRCGYAKIDTYREAKVLGLKAWEIETMRWVSTSQLLKPSTWGNGRWETQKRLQKETI